MPNLSVPKALAPQPPYAARGRNKKTVNSLKTNNREMPGFRAPMISIAYGPRYETFVSFGESFLSFSLFLGLVDARDATAPSIRQCAASDRGRGRKEPPKSCAMRYRKHRDDK